MDISNNINLQKLHIADGQLTNLDVSQNTKLSSLTCYNNNLAPNNLILKEGMTPTNYFKYNPQNNGMLTPTYKE